VTTQIGQLRQRVSIQAQVEVETDMGGSDITWVEVFNCRARVEALSGRELLVAQQMEASATHKVTFRYRSGVTAKHRLVIEGVPWNIRHNANPDERKVWLELLCEEGVAV
jgi:SPP1 family predicted phage head-tail adaptor